MRNSTNKRMHYTSRGYFESSLAQLSEREFPKQKWIVVFYFIFHPEPSGFSLFVTSSVFRGERERYSGGFPFEKRRTNSCHQSAARLATNDPFSRVSPASRVGESPRRLPELLFLSLLDPCSFSYLFHCASPSLSSPPGPWNLEQENRVAMLLGNSDTN